MTDRDGLDVSTERLLEAAAVAALVIVCGQFLLDAVHHLARYGEFRFDEADRLLDLLVGVLTTTAIVAGVYRIVEEGTDESVVVNAAALVYVAALFESLLRGVLFEWAEIESWAVLTSLSPVLFFLTFVLAYRLAFEDRDVTDWDPDTISRER